MENKETKKVKITSPIINEVCLRELSSREHEGQGMSVYSKIVSAISTRKDGSVFIEVTEPELMELYREADYWSDSFDEYMMPKGEWLAYRALKKQCKALIQAN